MKKYSFLLIFLAFSMSMLPQKAVISFEEKVYDFGKINEDNGKVSHVFEFTNKGNSPLVVSKVQASCGCTTPTWTKEPIEPGKKGSITVTYNPEGRPSVFFKTITVKSNATDEELSLTIKGDVIPKLTNENAAYPVSIGDLRLRARIVQLNNVNKGDKQMRILNIQNTSKSLIKPTFENLPPYLSAVVFPETLKPNEEGKITFTFNSTKCVQWGPVLDEIYIILNSQRKYSDEYKLTVVGNVVEDFSKMTLDQKRKTPILEMPTNSLNLGELKKGQKKIGKFIVNNKGQNPLEIRRIINNCKEFTVKNTQLTVGPGRSASMLVALNSKNMTEGDYKKTFTIQTNDPDKSFLVLILSWTIKK